MCLKKCCSLLIRPKCSTSSIYLSSARTTEIEPDNLGGLSDGELCQKQKSYSENGYIPMNSTFPKVFIAGHRGMVGSAIYRHLIKSGLLKNSLITRKRLELDLTCQQDINRFFESNAIDQVYLAAAKVDGIHANNTSTAEFVY